jgi:hypothetical protein
MSGPGRDHCPACNTTRLPPKAFLIGMIQGILMAKAKDAGGEYEDALGYGPLCATHHLEFVHLVTLATTKPVE